MESANIYKKSESYLYIKKYLLKNTIKIQFFNFFIIIFQNKSFNQNIYHFNEPQQKS